MTAAHRHRHCWGRRTPAYTLVVADVGKTIKVKVAFTDRRGYSETRTSVATGAVAAAPNNPATGAPAIGGTAQVGETLTVHTSGIADDDGLTNSTYSYQWVANDGTTDTDIAGATNAAYNLVADDLGRTVKVRVSLHRRRRERGDVDQHGHGDGGGSAPARPSGHRGNQPSPAQPRWVRC